MNLHQHNKNKAKCHKTCKIVWGIMKILKPTQELPNIVKQDDKQIKSPKKE